MPSVLSRPATTVHRVGELANPIPDPYLLTTFVRDQPGSARWQPHAHEVAELVWVLAGVVNINVAGTIHVVRPGWGLLIPAGVQHDAQVMSSARIGMTFLRDDATAQPTSVRMNRALTEMLQHLNETPMPEDERIRAQRVCQDMIRSSHLHHGGVVVPTDPRIRNIARAILADPADDRSLEQWSILTGSSVSTISRTFAETADMSFARWRRQVRVNAAMSFLADGVSVAVAGRRVGYHSPSAFVTAFRQEIGRTPGDFVRERAAAGLI